jgi:two-component system, LytTR family, sensor kinase
MRKNKSRFIYMILLGVAIAAILNISLKFENDTHNKLYDYFIAVIITICVWEGNLRIDSLMNINFPWEKSAVKRLLIHLPLSILFSAFSIYFLMIVYNKYFCPLPAIHLETLLRTCLVMGLLVSLITLSVEISMQFFKNWKSSLLEIERHKSETVQAQLQNLKNQVNPHFLFNNLSVLSSLVYKDQDKAVDFINQLSKVYRYLLDNRNSELVTLDSELTFIKSYNYLLQIRFDKNIVFDINIPEDNLKKIIPPMSLQMLIENAIKHNEISIDLPLTIYIFIDENRLVIKNNLQLRTNPEESSKTGLQNIKDRFRFYTERQLEIIESEEYFIVKMPLI